MADNRPDRGKELRRILLAEGSVCEARDIVCFDDLSARLAVADADVVLVTICDKPAEALAAIRTSRQVAGAPVIALGSNATVNDIRDVMRAGAREFIDLKPGPSDLALMLDIQPQHTTNEICRAWPRMDRRMLQSALTRHNLDVARSHNC